MRVVEGEGEEEEAIAVGHVVEEGVEVEGSKCDWL